MMGLESLFHIGSTKNQYETGAGIANILSLKRWADRNFINGTGFASPKLPTITPFFADAAI